MVYIFITENVELIVRKEIEEKIKMVIFQDRLVVVGQAEGTV
jgi:hypothetical protein